MFIKRQAVLLVFGAALIAGLGWVLGAAGAGEPKQPAQPATPPGVALVDVGEVLKTYDKLTKQIEEIKREVVSAETDLKTRRDELVRIQARLENVARNSPEYDRLSDQLVTKQAVFNNDTAKHKQRFMDRESVLYAKAFVEVAEVVEHYAKQHGLSLVIRYSNDALDMNNRESVMRFINKPVLFQSGLDVTAAIAKAVNQQQPASSE